MTAPDPAGRSDVDPPALLIVGGSTRAAAHSALRGGLRPVCADLFGDVDLQSHADVISVTHYPGDLPDALKAYPPQRWIYTGGFENHAPIVEQISARHRLLGNDASTLRLIRDPQWIVETLRAVDMPALEFRLAESPPPRGTAWLRKPFRGAGGRGIGIWDRELPACVEPYYFQKRIRGEPVSAQFLAAPGRTEFLGAVRQLVGLAAVHAAPFAWCGGIFPAEVGDEILERMTAIGSALASAAKLRGLFGCDFILSDGVPWLTEVNPRYTGAMELLEHRRGESLITRHIKACEAFDQAGEQSTTHASPTANWHSSCRSSGVVGKIVLYAERDSIADDARGLLIDPRDDRLPFLADVPPPGQRIPAEFPVCTLFATDRHVEACTARLIRCANRFAKRFVRPAS